jgi:hypothetical protein
MRNKFDMFFWVGLTYTLIPFLLVTIGSSILIDSLDTEGGNPKVEKKEIYVEPQQPVVIGESKTKEVITTPKSVVVITPKPKVTAQDTVHHTGHHTGHHTVQDTVQVPDPTKKPE